MTAKEFVKRHYPSARALHSPNPYGFVCKHKYTVVYAINSIGVETILADGKTESNAWVNAKKFVLEKLKSDN